MQHPLASCIKPGAAVVRGNRVLAPQAADQTVWDTLAAENPTHAVISSADEGAAFAKSRGQLADLQRYLGPETVLLDLGAGYGRLGKYLLPQRPLGGYIALDSSQAMLRLCQEWYQGDAAAERTPLLLVHSDINETPLADASVDLVVVSAVFLHNHKSITAQAMAEVRRVLKPGGRLLVYSSFPNSRSLMGAQGACYQALLNLIGKPFKNGPVRYFSRREVERFVDGFSQVSIDPYGFEAIPKRIIIFPGFLDHIYRVGFANPANRLLRWLLPQRWQTPFAAYHDVSAVR